MTEDLIFKTNETCHFRHLVCFMSLYCLNSIKYWVSAFCITFCFVLTFYTASQLFWKWGWTFSTSDAHILHSLGGL